MVVADLKEASLSAPRQRDLFSSPQLDMFENERPAKAKAKPAFRIDPEDVRRMLQDYVDELKALESWPWPKDLVDLLHSMSWPFLFEELRNPAEAREWKVLLEKEAARLDAATIWPA